MNSTAKPDHCDVDGFIKVKYKRRQKLQTIPRKFDYSSYEEKDFDLDDFKQRLFSEVIQFVVSYGMVELKQLFGTALQSPGWEFEIPKSYLSFHDIALAMKHQPQNCSNVGIVCYGLASFTYFIRSRKQLAFLIALALGFGSRVYIFDPVFNDQDKKVLHILSMVDIHVNELAKRKVDKNTLFFMPHCPHELYNNVLAANWSAESLMKVAIVGNGFRGIVEGSRQEDIEKYKYLHKAISFVNEYPIPKTCCGMLDFSSLHTFSSDTIDELPQTTWIENENNKL